MSRVVIGLQNSALDARWVGPTPWLVRQASEGSAGAGSSLSGQSGLRAEDNPNAGTVAGFLHGWNSVRQISHEATFSRLGYSARDSTAIEARETFTEANPINAGKQPRPKRAEACECGTRIERQCKQTLGQQLAALLRVCSIGTKKSSEGHQEYWRGFKLHLVARPLFHS